MSPVCLHLLRMDSQTSGFPWRTCFGPGRISRIAAVLDKAEQALSGALFFDRGTEGAEAGGGLVSASALFAILDYLAVETSIRVLRASGRTGTAVTANMALGYLELPRVPGLVHFRNRVDRVEGRKIFLAIEARDSPGGKPYARGTALFVSVPGGPPKL
ncbi:hypothetical protein DFJ74DRAFT_389571 [Hyaloraphidium curvatum]|nr:hypothetical protein DFJ74DRAFT_389571 [Hyaloraphidium curvatum]